MFSITEHMVFDSIESGTLVPILLVGLLPVLYAGIRYWKRTHAKVNCWFCNLNTIIPIKCYDGWLCAHCKQYNGFKLDGDYNREIPGQWDSSLNGRLSFCSRSHPLLKPPENGLCQDCNRNQELKVAQLASFQPINPENFDDEIENFRYHLERAYRLCPLCESVLDETLSRKKTLVLDMNLQLTGKKGLTRYPSSIKDICRRALMYFSAMYSMVTAFAITFATVSVLSPEHLLARFLGHSHDESFVCDRISPLSYFLPPQLICTTSEISANAAPTHPIFAFHDGSFAVYLDFARVYNTPLCLSALAFQIVFYWILGRKSFLLLWTVFLAIVLSQQTPVESSGYVLGAHILQVILTILILASSSQVLRLGEVRLTSTLKKPSRGTPSLSNHRPKKIEPDRLVNSASKVQSHSFRSHPNHHQPQPQGMESQEKKSLVAPDYMPLQLSVSNSIIQQDAVSCVTLAHNSECSTNLDILSNISQEDNRSDGSVDSAFSKSDSFNLDGVDSVSCSFSQYSGINNKSNDNDVHSLIEGLSIGTLSNAESRKNSTLFRKRKYGKEVKRNSVLSPPKLTNVFNESALSGLWRRTNTGVQSMISAGAAEMNSRPSSPCGSVHSESAFHLPRPAPSFSPVSSLQPMVSPWNHPPPSQSNLSVCVPPNPLTSNSFFGAVASSPYSPSFGLFYQMVSPAMYVMPTQSPTFSNKSLSSHGSRFSPRSIRSTSQRDLSFDSEIEQNDDSSFKSYEKRQTKASFLSSFVESMWHSRLAIMYTTLSYIVLGSLIGAFFYRDFMVNVCSRIASRIMGS